MRKKLIFPKVDYAEPNKDNYITISKNKIVDYHGAYPILSKKSKKHNGKVYINEKYTLSKIDKHDRYSYDVKGTHMIHSDQLEEYVHAPCFIHLNFYESLYTTWYLKKFLIQDMDFKKNVISGIIGLIAGAIINELFS